MAPRCLRKAGRSRPGASHVQSGPSGPTVGQRLHLCFDLAGICLRRLHHRRLRTANRRLEAVVEPTDPIRARCARTGASRAASGRRAGASQRPRIAICVDSLHRRLAEAGIEPSVGSVGDSYDNALAETIDGLYKAEVVHRRSWRSREELELATLRWVDWYNHRRLLGSIGYILPAEAEANYYQQRQHVTET